MLGSYCCSWSTPHSEELWPVIRTLLSFWLSPRPLVQCLQEWRKLTDVSHSHIWDPLETKLLFALLLLWCSSLKSMYLLSCICIVCAYVFLCVWVMHGKLLITFNILWVWAHAMAYMWSSEENLWGSALAFYHMGLRAELSSSGLAATPLPSELSHDPSWFSSLCSHWTSALSNVLWMQQRENRQMNWCFS